MIAFVATFLLVLLAAIGIIAWHLHHAVIHPSPYKTREEWVAKHVEAQRAQANLDEYALVHARNGSCPPDRRVVKAFFIDMDHPDWTWDAWIKLELRANTFSIDYVLGRERTGLIPSFPIE